jgi:P-type Ca2+ transporter type 2C
VLCNTAALGVNGSETGDPLEVGLLKFAIAQGTSIEAMRKENPVVQEEPFSSETKVMATRHLAIEGKSLIYAKGAAEELLDKCTYVINGTEEFELHGALKKTCYWKLKNFQHLVTV